MKVLIKKHPYPGDEFTLAELTLNESGRVEIRHVDGSTDEFNFLLEKLQSGDIYDPRDEPSVDQRRFTLADGKDLLEVLPYFYRTPYYWAEVSPS